MIERKDNEFAYKKMLCGLLFVAGCVPFFIWIASQSYGDENDKKLTTSGWIGIAAFVAYAILALVLIRRPEDHYRCPHCGAHIKMRPWTEELRSLQVDRMAVEEWWMEKSRSLRTRMASPVSNRAHLRIIAGSHRLLCAILKTL